MKQLEKLIEDLEKLESDKFHRLSIFNKHNAIIYKNIDFNFVLDNFDNINNFLEDLKSFKVINVTPINRKRAGEKYTIEFESTPSFNQTEMKFEDNTMQPQPNPIQPPLESYSPQIIPNNNLMGLGGFGLSGPEVTFRTMHYPELKEKVKELDTENKNLKEKNETLSRKNFELEIEIKNTADRRESNKEMIGLMGTLGAPLLEKFMTKQQGLSEPAPAKFDSAITNVLDHVGTLLTKSEDFYIELDDLIKKYLK